MAKSKYFWLPLFISAAIFIIYSDIFYGLRDFSLSINIGNLTFETLFDLNLFKIVVGLAFMMISTEMLQGNIRRIGGFAFFLMAFVWTIPGVIPFNINEMHILLPIRMIYLIIFLPCWYVLTFYADIPSISFSKVIKTYIWIIALVIGLSALYIFFNDMKHYSMSIYHIFNHSEYRLFFSIGLALILTVITFLWKDIIDGKGLSLIFSETLFWGLFIMPVIILACSILGYISFFYASPMLSLSNITLEWDIFISCAWLVILFQIMYKYRIKQQTHNVFYILSTKVPLKTLRTVFKLPIWFLFTAIPMFLLRLFSMV